MHHRYTKIICTIERHSPTPLATVLSISPTVHGGMVPAGQAAGGLERPRTVLADSVRQGCQHRPVQDEASLPEHNVSTTKPCAVLQFRLYMMFTM